MLTNQSSLSPEKAAKSLLSSNFTFYDSVWTAAKNCTGVTGISQRFYWEPTTRANRRNKKFFSAMVDIVASDGHEWVKVCSITERRMIYDMAKAGLVWGSESDESDADHDLDDSDDDEGLLKVAKSLVKASKANRLRYKHPRIRMVLPRITFGSSKDIDRVLRQISAMGITLQTAGDIKPPSPLAESLSQIPVDRLTGFGDILNLDCTILITLVSDMCHAQVAKAEWHHKNVNRQIEVEKEELILSTFLWPIFSSRNLVCTTEAAEKLKEIVNIIGTPSEKQRTDLLMGAADAAKLTREQRLEEFQKLSIYDVPKEWQLPISVVDVDIPATIAKFPRSGEILSKTFSEINRSVFLYGWTSGTTTITTNGVVAREIERVIEADRTHDEDAFGPDIWLFPSPRSLVGTERVRGEKFRLSSQDKIP